jgi:hypothetical protein
MEACLKAKNKKTHPSALKQCKCIHNGHLIWARIMKAPSKNSEFPESHVIRKALKTISTFVNCSPQAYQGSYQLGFTLPPIRPTFTTLKPFP